MKKETYANKLAELLGLDSVKKEVDKKKEESKGSKFQGITETEIQTYREAQGIIYFLQAPKLFTLKTCPHCKAEFLVSRLYVGYCSYTCIAKSMEEDWGITWKRGHDIEALVNELYEGNEPIWIRNLPKLREALEILTVSQASPL